MHLLNVVDILRAGGYIAIFGIVFAETGILLGFFLPGDSLLFTAGFLASQGYLNVGLIILIAFVAAILGDNTGFFLGKKYGRKIFSNKESKIFNPSHMQAASDYYQKNGGKTIVIAHFIPAIRAAAPFITGIANLKYKTFIIYDVLGVTLWTVGLSLLGYSLGKYIPKLNQYLTFIVIGIVIVSVLPSLITFLKHRYLSKVK